MIRDLLLVVVLVFAAVAISVHTIHTLYSRYEFVDRCKEFGEVEKCELIFERSVEDGLP